MNDLQQWIDDPARDYAVGVALFARYSPNKMLVRYFNTGTARFRMDKLVYEMGKLAKMADKRANVRVNNDSPRQEAPVFQPIERADRRANAPSPQLPTFILAAKKEVAALYALIDKQHRELYDLGTSNEDAVVRKRKKILDGRKPAIDRADRLYQLKEEWFNLKDGTAKEKVANEIREMLAAPLEEQPTMAAPAHTPPPIDVAGMSDIDLTKRRSQLSSTITKTRNMLQYQSIRKGDKPTPLPDGPKRDEYERKLSALQAEFQAVTGELERRGK